MRRLVLSVLMIAPLLAAGGCEQLKDTFGLSKRAPDEFAVYSRDPLTMPSSFTLPSPTPGIDRPALVAPKDKALGAILGPKSAAVRVNRPAAGGDGFAAFKREIGAVSSDPKIRSVVNVEDERLQEEDKSWTDRFKFWGVDTVWGLAVDPEQEAKRIQANRALGLPINEGEVPVLKQKRKALLEGLL